MLRAEWTNLMCESSAMMASAGNTCVLWYAGSKAGTRQGPRGAKTSGKQSMCTSVLRSVHRDVRAWLREYIDGDMPLECHD
jgi:hypothetical protein